MDLTLIRTDKREDGVFGILATSLDTVALTLEHSYDAQLGDGSYTAKLQPGTYRCVRGMHRLHNMTEDFETFEITGVTGHTNILFHWGNFNDDSEGCVLLGRNRIPSTKGDGDMITSSRNTFNKFMDLQKNVSEFTLTVKDSV